ncbi:putative Copper transporter [Diplonema papillatum]|nr:putative Copper transporter [Diplonema papillatum]
MRFCVLAIVLVQVQDALAATPVHPATCEAQSRAECLDCMVMNGTCMSMSGQEGCSSKSVQDCLECAWSTTSNSCVSIVTPSPPAPTCSDVKAQTECLDCMFMSGKCMSMSGQEGCSSKSVQDCLECAWSTTSNSCVSIVTPSPPAPTCSDVKAETECLDCMFMSGKCMSMSGQEGCSSKSVQDCLDCAWSTTSKSCGSSAPSPATKTCADAKTESACWDCMVMQGKCMSMSGQQGCSSEPAGNCLSCYWSGAMCMPTKSGGGGMGVGMAVTFYSSHKVVILFDQWNVETVGQYVLSIICVFVAGIATPLLKDYVTAERNLPLAVRGLLVFVNFCFVYSLMLVIMTYNVGIFFAAMAGLTVGWMVGERLKVTAYAKMQAERRDVDDLRVPLASDINCH